MRLYIIRHGETLWNTEGRLQGKADIDLNENGVRLAKVTAKGMKDIPFDLAITSPLIRARRTAELVLGDRQVPIIEDARIQEITFGSWEGLCCKKDNYQIPSEEFPKFFSDPFHYQPPEDGESILQLIERTGAFYDELIHNPEYQDKTILIASHGCSCRGIMYSLYEVKENVWRGNVPPNCGVAIIDVKDGVSTFVEVDKVYYDPNEIKNYYGNRKE